MASGYGKEVENVQHFQTNGQTEGHQTKSDQKSSYELSAQVKTSWP